MTTDFFTIAEIENLQVIDTTSAMNGYPEDLKDDVLEMLSGPHMSGCITPVRSTDARGNNENYGATPVDSFFDEDGGDYLPDSRWLLTGFKVATPESVNLDIWAQEFDDMTKSSLEKSLEDGSLYVASFWNDYKGGNDILIWK